MCTRSLHIAVGVIRNRKGEILVALRPDDVVQGGLWEFPGGKVEAGEDVPEALARELDEELGLQVGHARPLIRVHHTYPEYAVLLDVWQIDAWHGQVHGREGQIIDWVAADQLDKRDFPVANRPIIKSLQLPSVYLITPDRDIYDERFMQDLESCLRSGIRLLQLRSPRMKSPRYREVLKQVCALCQRYKARLLINAGNPDIEMFAADGVHLPARCLLQLNKRPLGMQHLVAASCHNRMEVEHACRLGVDFIVAAPVQPTRSHPRARPLGWDGFRYLSEYSSVPVYALGGLSAIDIPRAWQEGAQGIAMISAVWSAPDPAIAVRECIEIMDEVQGAK